MFALPFDDDHLARDDVHPCRSSRVYYDRNPFWGANRVPAEKERGFVDSSIQLKMRYIENSSTIPSLINVNNEKEYMVQPQASNTPQGNLWHQTHHQISKSLEISENEPCRNCRT